MAKRRIARIGAIDPIYADAVFDSAPPVMERAEQRGPQPTPSVTQLKPDAPAQVASPVAPIAQEAPRVPPSACDRERGHDRAQTGARLLDHPVAAHPPQGRSVGSGASRIQNRVDPECGNEIGPENLQAWPGLCACPKGRYMGRLQHPAAKSRSPSASLRSLPRAPKTPAP